MLKAIGLTMLPFSALFLRMVPVTGAGCWQLSRFRIRPFQGPHSSGIFVRLHGVDRRVQGLDRRLLGGAVPAGLLDVQECDAGWLGQFTLAVRRSFFPSSVAVASPVSFRLLGTRAVGRRHALESVGVILPLRISSIFSQHVALFEHLALLQAFGSMSADMPETYGLRLLDLVNGDDVALRLQHHFARRGHVAGEAGRLNRLRPPFGSARSSHAALVDGGAGRCDGVGVVTEGGRHAPQRSGTGPTAAPSAANKAPLAAGAALRQPQGANALGERGGPVVERRRPRSRGGNTVDVVGGGHGSALVKSGFAAGAVDGGASHARRGVFGFVSAGRGWPPSVSSSSSSISSQS